MLPRTAREDYYKPTGKPCQPDKAIVFTLYIKNTIGIDISSVLTSNINKPSAFQGFRYKTHPGDKCFTIQVLPKYYATAMRLLICTICIYFVISSYLLQYVKGMQSHGVIHML
jgi:hypothetical protein